MKTVVGIKNDKNTESMLQIIKKGTNQLSQIQEKQLLSSKEEAFREFMELVQNNKKSFLLTVVRMMKICKTYLIKLV